jgi:hypothetical protein
MILEGAGGGICVGCRSHLANIISTAKSTAYKYNPRPSLPIQHGTMSNLLFSFLLYISLVFGKTFAARLIIDRQRLLFFKFKIFFFDVTKKERIIKN